MESRIFSAKTAEEAIESGLAELGISRDEAEIEILEEGKKKLFGSIPAQVKITPKEKPSDGMRPVKYLIYYIFFYSFTCKFPAYSSKTPSAAVTCHIVLCISSVIKEMLLLKIYNYFINNIIRKTIFQQSVFYFPARPVIILQNNKGLIKSLFIFSIRIQYSISLYRILRFCP